MSRKLELSIKFKGNIVIYFQTMSRKLENLPSLPDVGDVGFGVGHLAYPGREWVGSNTVTS